MESVKVNEFELNNNKKICVDRVCVKVQQFNSLLCPANQSARLHKPKLSGEKLKRKTIAVGKKSRRHIAVESIRVDRFLCSSRDFAVVSNPMSGWRN